MLDTPKKSPLTLHWQIIYQSSFFIKRESERKKERNWECKFENTYSTFRQFVTLHKQLENKKIVFETKISKANEKRPFKLYLQDNYPVRVYYNKHLRVSLAEYPYCFPFLVCIV